MIEEIWKNLPVTEKRIMNGGGFYKEILQQEE